MNPRVPDPRPGSRHRTHPAVGPRNAAEIVPRGAALVTGSTRGIGLGIARALAADGWDLMLNGVRPAQAAAPALAELAAAGVRAAYCQADITRADDRAHLLDSVAAELGPLRLLVNNAGIAPTVRADILEAEEPSFEALIAANLQGPYFLTQAAARRMLADDQPAARAIVFITSVSAAAASPNRGDYCIAKAGLSMAARLWAVRLAEHAIPVYEVRPGIVQTDMTAGVHAKYERMIADGLLLEPRWGQPADIGRAVAALARGDLPYATGAILTLDGGMLIDRL